MATLVTGGIGYVGSHTVVALHESGRDVVVVDDFSGSSPRAVDALRGLTSANLPVVEGDIADRAVLRAAFSGHRVDSVIHFAAFKSIPESQSEPLRYYRNNLVSTISIAEAAVEHGVDRLVFSSSAAVYGKPTSVPVEESATLAPSNPYGHTKLMCERILRDVAAATSLDVLLLRYFNPVGAHESGLIGEDPAGQPGNLVPRIMKTVTGQLGPVPVFGSDYDTPDGTPVRDYIHVIDLAEGHLAALNANHGVCGSVYNLGTGKGSSVLDVLAAAEQATGWPVAREMKDRRPGDVASIWADCRRACRDLGWTARRDLDTMLRDHWNWQRLNPRGYRA